VELRITFLHFIDMKLGLGLSPVFPLGAEPIPSSDPSSGLSPGGLVGLTLWLDAADPATIIGFGGRVSQWNDKGGSGNDVTQSIGSKQPSTGTDVINGFNALSFDGVDDYLQRINFTGGVLSQPNTIIMVWELPALPATGAQLIDGGATGERHVIEFRRIADNNEIWGMWAGNHADGTVRTINTPYITTSLFNGNSSEGYINGVLDISGNVSTQALNGTTIAAAYDVAGFLKVKIGEIIVYPGELTDFDRQQVETSLSDKWSIPLG